MKRAIATTLAALVAAGGFWVTAGVNAEASTRAPRAHATQVAKPHVGQRCAAYNRVKRGQHRSCIRWVNR